MAVNDPARLGCGRHIDDVWAGAEDPPDAHERGCPFCRRARASMQQVSEAADALRHHEDESPEYTPGIGVKDLVMQLVHVEVRRGRAIPLLTPDEPQTPPLLTISEQAVLDVVWRAADALPGIRARHCAVSFEPGQQQPGQPALVDVELDIAVAAGVPVPRTTALLRALLAERVHEETGLLMRRTTVTVEDLYDA